MPATINEVVIKKAKNSLKRIDLSIISKTSAAITGQ